MPAPKPKQPDLSSTVLALLQMLGKQLLPATAQAEVVYHDPESAQIGQEIEQNQNPTYQEWLYQQILKAAQAHPETTNVYGPGTLESQLNWARPGMEGVMAQHDPFTSNIYLGSGLSRPPLKAGPYGLAHELTHFLQNMDEPFIPQGLNPEVYPYALLGNPTHSMPSPTRNPADFAQEHFTASSSPMPPERSFRQLDEFYRGYVPDLPPFRGAAAWPLP